MPDPDSNSGYVPTLDTTNVKSLNHFNSKALTDEISNATWTVADGAEFTTQDSKFGNACISIPYDRYNSNAVLKGIGSAKAFNIDVLTSRKVIDFEFWVKITTDITQFEGTNSVLFIMGVDESEEAYGKLTGSIGVKAYDGVWKIHKNSEVGITPNEWTHILYRFSFEGYQYIFFNGIWAENSYYHLYNFANNNVNLSNINMIGFSAFGGYVDEFICREITVNENTDSLDYDETSEIIIPTGPYSSTGEIMEEYTPIGPVKSLGGGVMQMRGGTAAVLASVNPLLARREIMVEVDTGQMKIGTGTQRWNSLKYVGQF